MGLLVNDADFNAITAPRHSRPATMRHCTNRTAISNARSGSKTQQGGQFWQISYMPVINGTVRIGVWNGAILPGGAGESGNGGTMTFRAAIIQPDGTKTATYSVDIADNAVGFLDIPGVTIAAFKKFFVRWDMSMAGSGRVPSINFSNCCDRANGDQYLLDAAGYGHIQDATVLGSGEVNGWLPQYVAAMSDRSVWALITDSLGEVNDTTFELTGGRGMFGRAAALWGPHLNYATPGDRASIAAAGFTARTALLAAAGANAAILNLGRNDVTNSRTAAQILTDRATLRTAIKTAGVSTVIDTTVPPYTTSTDLWNTTANQSQVSAPQEIVRSSLNDYMRGAAAYATTGTLTNGSAVVTAVASLTLLGLFPGMTITSGTSGIPGGTTISSIDYVAGSITLSASFTGTTTVGATITGTQPTISGTFPLPGSDGLLDVCALLEGAKTMPFTPVRNGGVWLPGLVSLDGLHINTNGITQIEPLVRSAYSMRA